MITRLKEHWGGIVVSILIGAVITAPAVIWRLSPLYSGVPLLKQNTETHYAAQIQEVYDGRTSLGNPFLGGELKNAPYLFPPLAPILTAYFGMSLGLNIVQTLVVVRFLATSFLAFLIYILGFSLSGKKIVGLVAAPFVMLGYALVDPRHIIDLFNQSDWSQEKQFIDYGRPTNPQISSLFFFAYLVFFWRYLRDNSKKYLGVASTLLLGLSFYVYLYTWSFIFVLNGFLFIIFAFQKDWIKMRKTLFVSGAAFVIGIPYFIHNYNITLHPLYAEVSPRFGFFRSRVPEISRLSIISAVLFALSRKLFFKEAKIFFMASILTSIVIVNEQIVIGFYVFNHHWHWYYVTPLVIIFLTVFLFTLLDKLAFGRKISGIVGCLLVFLFFYNGTVTQRISYAIALPAVIDEQRYAPFFGWLNANAGTDTTVFASDEIMSLIPVLTTSNVYYHGTGIYTMVSTKQLLHVYLVNTYLRGIRREDIRAFLENNRNDISYFAFGYTYRLKPGVCLGCFPDEVIDWMVNEYKTLDDKNLIEYMKKYPVDYVIWDKKNYPDWKFDRFDSGKVFEENNLILYRF